MWQFAYFPDGYEGFPRASRQSTAKYEANGIDRNDLVMCFDVLIDVGEQTAEGGRVGEDGKHIVSRSSSSID